MKVKDIRNKLFSIIIAILIILSCSNEYVYATNTIVQDPNINKKNKSTEIAKSITKTATFSADGNKVGMEVLNDEELSTKYKMEEAQTIKIVSKYPIASIYILFNKAPKIWELTTEDGQQSPYGRYEFLHELVELSEEQREVQLSFEANTEICDIYLFTKGQLPSNIEKWQPPYEDADMLLLPTHAGDEYLCFGGILPYYAGELGKKVQVAYLTNSGESIRQHELLEGLWQVGVKAYPIIPKFKDNKSNSLEHAKTLYDTDEMLKYQVELLRKFKPEVVVGHDVKGENGDGIRMLNTHLLLQALELSKDQTAMPESCEIYGAFDVPKTYLHSYKTNPITLNYDMSLKNFNNKTAFEMAQEGFEKNQSQANKFEIKQNGKDDCRQFGLYRTTVGNDVSKNDLFENIKQPAHSIASSKATNSEKHTTSSQEASSSKPTVTTNEAETSREMRGSLFIIAGILIIIFTINRMNKRKKNFMKR